MNARLVLRWTATKALIVTVYLLAAGCLPHASAPVPGLIAPVIDSWSVERPSDIIAMPDCSGSMLRGPHATDPNGRSLKAEGALLDFIADRSDAALPDRFGLVNFGSTAPIRAAIPLTPVCAAYPKAISALHRQIRFWDLGDTSFVAGLMRCCDLFDQGGPMSERRNRAIIIFTDGEPDDLRHLTQAQYFAEIGRLVFQKLKPRGIQVFVIGIDGSSRKFWSASAPSWRALLGTDHVLTLSDMAQLQRQYHRILLRIWNLPDADPIEVGTAQRSDFDVPPYLASLVLCVFPNQPNAKVHLFRPDGREVAPGKDLDAAVARRLRNFIRIEVREPQPGTWRLEASSERAEVLRIPIPLRLRLLSPGPTHPCGKPLALVAEFCRLDGRPVVSQRDYPLALSAEVSLPGGRHVPVKFQPVDGQGTYIADQEIRGTEPAGQCEVLLKVSGGGAYRSQYPAHVQFGQVPYLDVLRPARGESLKPAASVPVLAHLMRSGKPIRARENFSNHPDMLALAQVTRRTDGMRGPALWLNAAEEGAGTVFRGMAPTPGAAEAPCILALRIAPDDPTRLADADRTITYFRLHAPPVPLWERALLLGLGLSSVGGVCAFLLIRHRRERLRLPIYIRAEGMPAITSLVFTQPNETRIVPGLPIEVTRIRSHPLLRIVPVEGHSLLRPDGTSIPALEFADGCLVHVHDATGNRRSIAISRSASLAAPAPASSNTPDLTEPESDEFTAVVTDEDDQLWDVS